MTGDSQNKFVLKPIQEIQILWLTAGLGCDGDTIAMWTENASPLGAVSSTTASGWPGCAARCRTWSCSSTDVSMPCWRHSLAVKAAPALLAYASRASRKTYNASGTSWIAARARSTDRRAASLPCRREPTVDAEPV